MCSAASSDELVARIEADIEAQLSAKRKRLKHSRAVAKTAVELADLYGVDRHDALCAGLLHDYAKAYSNDELLEKAAELGLDYGCDLKLVLPILHGPIAARELRGRYPELDEAVFTAIERHTVATCDMSPLDMVIFIADGIEPGRPATPDIERQRAEVGKVPLEELFLDALSASIGFVIETKRYLWPGALESYNRYVLDRNR